MLMRIKIPPPLRKFTGGLETVEVSAGNLNELFEALEGQFSGIKEALANPDGTPKRFINIYVNDEDIRFLGGAGYAFREGDEILLIPAIAGGSGPSTALPSTSLRDGERSRTVRACGGPPARVRLL